MATNTEEPGKGSLTLTGKAPSLSFVKNIYPGKGALAFTGSAPTLFIQFPFAGDADLPVITGEGTADFGNIFSGDLTLAPIERSITFGWQGVVALPAVAMTATLQTGRIFTGNARLPAIQVDATASLTQSFSANIALPSLQGSGALFVGAVFSADLTLEPIEGEGTFYQTVTFTADLDLQSIEAEAVLLTGSLFAGALLELPALELEATFSDATTLTYYALSTNTINLGHGQYTNTEYDGLGRLGAKTYAAMSDGLYRIDGVDDAGVPIEALFLTGYADFGVEAVKSQRVAYFGGSWDGPIEILVRADTEGAELYSYSVEDPHETAQDDAPARVKLGRGLRGRYWQTGMRNCDGAQFHIDRIGLGVWNSTRKR